MNKADIIKRIARNMLKKQHSSNLGKKEAHAVFKARVNKKKIPQFKNKKKEDNRPIYTTDEQQRIQRETEQELFG